MQTIKNRTKAFALRIIKLYSALPSQTVAQVIGQNILSSGTSVGASYREASRAEPTTEFISKVNICIQNLEATIYWLELLVEAEILPPDQLKSLLSEANELIASLVSTVNRAELKQ